MASKIDEVRAQQWNNQVNFQRNLSSNSVVVLVYRKVLVRFEAAHSQICEVIRRVKGLNISPVTLAEAEDSVLLNNGGRLFPNTAYKPNPVNYLAFSPFKPPILQQVWTLDDGSNPDILDTDLSVLEASPNPDFTASNLQKSLQLLAEFIPLSLSYLSSEEQIESINNSDLIELQALIELEKTSLVTTGGTTTGTGSNATVTPVVKSYKSEFLVSYANYIKTRTKSFTELERLCLAEANSVNSLYYRWLEYYCHRTEGALSKYSMSKRSLDVSKDSLRIAEDKYNILRI